MTSMVYCVLRTEHPCPQPDDVHGLLRCENRAALLLKCKKSRGVKEEPAADGPEFATSTAHERFETPNSKPYTP